MKRIISLLMSFVMLFAVTAGVDFSALADNVNGDFQYRVLEDGTAEITKYKGYDFDVAIPYQLDEYRVSAIGYEAFKDCSNIKTVSLPLGLNRIEEFAFAYCSNLENVLIRNNLFEIAAYSFMNCESLKNILLPRSLEYLGEFCFSGCISLESVRVLSSKCIIGKYAFGDEFDKTVVYGYENTTTPKSCEKWGYQFLPMTANPAQIKFSDIKEFAIYNDYVEYTSLYNFFIAGTNAPEYTLFSPKVSLTRAMLVAILYRMANNPYSGNNPHTVNPFSDVNINSYYYDAACWALDNKITNQTTFKPNDNVTREQTARFLFAYAESKGKLGSSKYKDVDILHYPDYSSVHDWAVEPLKWANFNNMITGTQQGYINPQGNTQRIHATRILYGFGRLLNIGNFE